MSIERLPWEDKSEGDVETLYEVAYYSCPKVPLKQCDRTKPGMGRVVRVWTKPSDMQTFHKAFQLAGRNAPVCDIHGETMVPQLLSLPKAK